jgi:L-alanine-DL-glutamate epimerase-like enolase superfamily enzyme
MRIAKVESFPISLTLARPVKMSNATIAKSHNVLVKITTDEGLFGWGEGVSAPQLTGQNQKLILASIARLTPFVLGEDPIDVASIWRKLSNLEPVNQTAIGALDIALHDIAGKALGLPICKVLNNHAAREIAALTLLGTGDATADLKEAQQRYARGVRWFKLKLGLADAESEIETLAAMADALGDDAVISGDVNGGWSETEAVRTLKKLDRLRIRFIEQPVSSENPRALARVAAQAPIAICADESVQCLDDIRRLATTAVAGASLKLVKLGGITGVMQAARLCESLGLHINLAGKVAESSIAAAANVHAAAALPVPFFGVSPANQGIEQDVSPEPLELVGGKFYAPQRPGLGIFVDERLMASLRSSG